MEQLAGDLSLMLLAGTPFLVLAKLVHALATWRLSFARRGSRPAKAESVAWLLLAAVDFHTLAPWSSLANVATAVFVAAAVAVLVHAAVRVHRGRDDRGPEASDAASGQLPVPGRHHGRGEQRQR